ncbi:unnamed protein product, partial [Choristocarpus tenellus]
MPRFLPEDLVGARVETSEGWGIVRNINRYRKPETGEGLCAVTVELTYDNSSTQTRRTTLTPLHDLLRAPLCATGACVLTSFGTGVVVGYRSSDNVHIVRLWAPRGRGSALGFIRREDLLRSLPAAVGLRVTTPFGEGMINAFHPAADAYGDVFMVRLHWGIAYLRGDSVRCPVAKVMPLVEKVVDRSNAMVREQMKTGELGTQARELLVAL